MSATKTDSETTDEMIKRRREKLREKFHKLKEANAKSVNAFNGLKQEKSTGGESEDAKNAGTESSKALTEIKREVMRKIAERANMRIAKLEKAKAAGKVDSIVLTFFGFEQKASIKTGGELENDKNAPLGSGVAEETLLPQSSLDSAMVNNALLGSEDIETPLHQSDVQDVLGDKDNDQAARDITNDNTN